MKDLVIPQNAADVFTLTRLYAIIPLTVLLVYGFEKIFLAVYIVAILTDALDGFVARMQHTASARGAYLDGVVDFIFSFVSIFWIVLIDASVFTLYSYAISIAAIAFVLFLVLSYWHTQTFISPHTNSAKVATALFVLFVPLLLLDLLTSWYVYVTAASIVFSRLETIVYVFKDEA